MPVSLPAAVGMLVVLVATSVPLRVHVADVPAAFTSICALYHVFRPTVMPVSVAVSVLLLRVTNWNLPELVPLV